MTAPPIPVPKTKTKASFTPTRLPDLTSASAAQFASFSTVTGTPQIFWSSSVTQCPLQKSNAPLEIQTPLKVSISPGMETPIPSTSLLALKISASFSKNSSWFFFGVETLPFAAILKTRVPVKTAYLINVPPTSTVKIFFIAKPPIKKNWLVIRKIFALTTSH